MATAGFSLMDAMVSAALTVGLVLSVLYAADVYQKSYLETQIGMDLQQSLRGVTELMAQEIGQAGLLSPPVKTLTAPVQPSTTPREIAVESAQGLFVGEKVLLGAAGSQEFTTVAAVGSGSFQAAVAGNHPSGAPVTALGVFPEGILPDSTSTRLRVFGDLKGDGGLELVSYVCDPAAGTLTRVVVPIGSSPSASVLLNRLTANPMGDPCFRLKTTNFAGWTFVTDVEVTLSTRSQAPNPRTGRQIEKTMKFKAASRNVAAALRLAIDGKTERLQPTPPEFQTGY